MMTKAAHPGLPIARALPSAGHMIKHFRTALNVAAERRALAALDANALADLGLTPADAAREAGRSFWDIPAGR